MKILLWKIRVEKDLTLLELAHITGLSKTHLNDIENERVSPRLDTLEILAQAMQVRITDLFDSDYK